MRKRLEQGFRVLLGSAALLAVADVSSARAQGYSSLGTRSSLDTMAGYNFAGSGSVARSSSTYLPLGGSMSGFVPYSPGSRGGLGVQSPMVNSAMLAPPGGMTMPGARRILGSTGSRITPLTPIESTGFPRGGPMGRTGTMIQRAPAGGAMSGMARPPVGGYPFRQAPPLIESGSAPAMSM
jgi:hypothetical protein